MRVIRLACIAATSALLGCGGGDGDATDPPPPPTNQTLGSITTNVTSVNLTAGNTQVITVSALDTQGAVITNPGTPTFSSVSTTIAEVDGSGTVLGLTSGNTTINVSLTRGGVTKTAQVTVTVTGTLPTEAEVSTLSGDVFTPSKVIIAEGGSVTWTFGPVLHTVSFTSGAGAPSNITSGVSSSQSRTFNQAGNFSYICTIHAGMNGQVIVR